MPVRAPASQLLTDVNSLYADPGCCGDPGAHAAAAIVDPRETKLFQALAAARHADPDRPVKDVLESKEWKALYGHIAESLIGGADKGYAAGAGKKLSQLKEGSQDERLVEKLRSNLHFFSAHKNYHLLVDLNRQLVDEKGQLRPWSAFRKEALKLSSQYNTVWLRTEYNAAVGASQMAAKWVGFTERDKGDTYLRYDTAGDKRVRPAHSKLDGIVLPLADPFWNIYYPVNSYNCRCSASEVLRSKETKTDLSKRGPLPEPTPGFRTNVGKAGEVFGSTHPYFTNTPPNIVRVLRDLANERTRPKPAPPKKD